MTIKFQVTGMTCAACSARVEKVTSKVPGVTNAEVNLLAGTMVVRAEEESVIPAIITAVTDAGYGAFANNGQISASPYIGVGVSYNLFSW